MTTRRIVVQQIKEWGEILVGFETRNRYELRDENEALIGHAAEEAGGFGRMFGRLTLGSMRRAIVHVLDPSGAELCRGDKPFRWYFHRMDVYAGETKLGAVERRFSILSRKFVVENARGEVVLEVLSPLWRIWTFKLLFRGTEVGVITKKWGGMLKEMFSDADRFGIEYSHAEELDALRPILICATFLIDFTCFENNRGGGGPWIPLGGD